MSNFKIRYTTSAFSRQSVLWLSMEQYENMEKVKVKLENNGESRFADQAFFILAHGVTIYIIRLRNKGHIWTAFNKVNFYETLRKNCRRSQHTALVTSHSGSLHALWIHYLYYIKWNTSYLKVARNHGAIVINTPIRISVRYLLIFQCRCKWGSENCTDFRGCRYPEAALFIDNKNHNSPICILLKPEKLF